MMESAISRNSEPEEYKSSIDRNIFVFSLIFSNICDLLDDNPVIGVTVIPKLSSISGD